MEALKAAGRVAAKAGPRVASRVELMAAKVSDRTEAEEAVERVATRVAVLAAKWEE